MTITKPIKHSGQAPRAPHKAANSPVSTSASAARKSSRVPRPSFKVIDSLMSLESPPSTKLSSQPSLKAANSFSSLSSSPSWPSIKAADSISSLTSSSSRPPLKAANSVVSLCSTTLSRASSPVSETCTHINVTDSEGEDDPQVELGTSTLYSQTLHLLTLNQTTWRRPGGPLFILSSSLMFLSSITMVDCVISSLVQHVHARQHSEASATFKTRRTRPRLQTYATMPLAASAKML